ncbi:MAG TPA: BAX inhibitor (BI)-1/YccA family protein, partial [Sediminispirochaeta sp.]|nr:BAX inhibitor (BI)-1/YccA family protein [Sediminispirochaeta sp.]
MAYSREQVLSIPQVRERNILRNVYLWMTAGLALTGVVAFGVANSPGMLRAIVGNQMIFLMLILGE